MRPKRNAKPDKNHSVPRDFLAICGDYQAKLFGAYWTYTAMYCGKRFLLIDVSKDGGIMPDWIIECLDTQQVRWLEVKTEDAFNSPGMGLQPAEKWLMEHSSNHCIIVTVQDVVQVMDGMLEA